MPPRTNPKINLKKKKKKKINERVPKTHNQRDSVCVDERCKERDKSFWGSASCRMPSAERGK